MNRQRYLQYYPATWGEKGINHNKNICEKRLGSWALLKSRRDAYSWPRIIVRTTRTL